MNTSTETPSQPASATRPDCAPATGSTVRVRYAFTVRGRTPDGNKIVLNGHITDEPGYPQSAFEKPLKLCLETVGSFTPDAKRAVVLRQLKK